MDISVLHHEGAVPVTVLAVRGQVTSSTSIELQQKSEELIQAGVTRLIYDLGGVTFMSSAGLRTVHQVLLLLSRQEGAEGEEKTRKDLKASSFKSPYLKLANLTPNVYHVFRTIGFDNFVEIYPDVTQALASFH